MDSFDFQVRTDLATINPNRIDCNFDEAKAWLVEALKPYRGLVVTDNDIRGAKDIRANINRVKTAINDQKKTVKKMWSAPLEEFEANCKELIAICDEAAGNIDVQIKDYEARKKDEKMARIKAVLEVEGSDISDYLKWERIYNPRWVNSTYKLEDAMQEVRDEIANTRRDLDTIINMEPEFLPAVLDEYARTNDLRAAVAKEKALKARQESISSGKDPAIQQKTEAGNPVAPATAPAPQPPVQEDWKKLYRIRLELHMTRKNMSDLKAFLQRNQIAYTQIK